MSYRTIVIILALLTALMPFLGFPYGFEKYFYLGAGLVIASLAYRMHESRAPNTSSQSAREPHTREREEERTGFASDNDTSQ